MDRPERNPLGTPNIRTLQENPNQPRRPIPNSATIPSAPFSFPASTPNAPYTLPAAMPNAPPPIPVLRKIPSNSNLSASNNTTPSQVIALAREAMREALQSENRQGADRNGVNGLKTGVTVDLSRKHISKLPDEVIDIVKNELERLALSHNQLTTLPARFTECTSLRYLNIRGNQIKEFPMALCELKALEILDLGRNQLRVLPNEIAQLTSLKVLSVPKNQIRELPLCLADMGSLQVIKFEGNPISFPPRDALQPQAGSPPNDGPRGDAEVGEVSITMNIKKYLRAHAANGRSESEATEDERSDAGEPPRQPLKRVVSGRFPIKVNGSDMSEKWSPNLGRTPPIPSRSHQRGFSQQSTAIRRPSVLPLTIGNANERVRSNSESVPRAERSESRQRRMGIVSKKASELGTLEEADPNNRFSHYRGLSHGSAMTGAPIPPQSNIVATDQTPNRPMYIRRLSVLPERRRESRIVDPMVEAAKGVLYSVFQVHPLIQAVMSLTNDGSAKRSSLEIVVYNTNVHVQELEQEIQKHDSMGGVEELDPTSQENENVQRACQTLIGAYGHVCVQLAENIDTLVDDGDPRYIRTLMMMIYHSIMEMRATLIAVHNERRRSQPMNGEYVEAGNTIRPYQREPSAPPSVSRPPYTRSRNGTMIHNPVNLTVTTNMPVSNINDVYMNGPGTGDMSSLASATPRSGESFVSLASRAGLPSEFTEEDAHFDVIFLLLQKATDAVMRTLPNFHIQLTGDLRNAMQNRAPRQLVSTWKHLISMCGTTIQQTEVLRNRLSVIKLKEPGLRSHPNFWNMCNNFISSWTDMAYCIKGAMNSLPLPQDTRLRLRPIQQSMKEASTAIAQSPWHHLSQRSDSLGFISPPGSQTITNLQVPITPQSAALGPAMQATQPSTPQSASLESAFQGNVFDRAGALMANPGIFMPRGRTMTRGHSGFNSLSSISSMSSDGTNNVTSPFSPNGSGAHGPGRPNGGKGI